MVGCGGEGSGEESGEVVVGILKCGWVTLGRFRE